MMNPIPQHGPQPVPATYQVRMDTPAQTRVWVARRTSGSFADVAVVVRPSDSKDQHLVVRFLKGSGDEYRFPINDLSLVTNARLPQANQGPFVLIDGTIPLTVQQARQMSHLSPLLFTTDDGQSTVDLGLPDPQLTQVLFNHTHVRRVFAHPYQNCLDFAVGTSAMLLSTLATLLTQAEAGGMQVLPIGDPAATVDLWGEPVGGEMIVQHGTRKYPGTNGLWGSVMGGGSRVLLLHTRYALAGGAAGSGYGQVLASLSGNRIG